MRKLKYIKLFEELMNSDFDNKGKLISGIDSLEPESKKLFDFLKQFFGEEPKIGTSDMGAVIGSNAGKRDVESIRFSFRLFKGKNQFFVTIYHDLSSAKPFLLSFEAHLHPESSYEKEFSNQKELISFIEENLKNFKK